MGVVHHRPLARAKLVDLALVGGAALLVLLSVCVGIVSDLATEASRQLTGAAGIDGGAIELGLSLVIPLVLWTATSLMLYRFVPYAGLRFQDALAGAVSSALVFLAISLISDVLYARTTDWNLIYGSLTTVLIFLYSVYLYAGALLFGAAVAAEWKRPPGPPPDPLVIRLRREIRGLFVREHQPGADAPSSPR
jgi:uncharacterized BrkB/YihY/UPF0761 family membrane protein